MDIEEATRELRELRREVGDLRRDLDDEVLRNSLLSFTLRINNRRIQREGLDTRVGVAQLLGVSWEDLVEVQVVHDEERELSL